MVVSDTRRFFAVPAEVAAARVYLSQSLGGVPGTLEHAQRAFDLLPAGDLLPGRATGTALVRAGPLGTRRSRGRCTRAFADALRLMREMGGVLDAIRGTFVLGDLRFAARAGSAEAGSTSMRQGLQLATEQAHSAPPESGRTIHLGLSEVHREWNDIEGATGFLDAITRSAAQTAHVGNKLRWCTAMASVRVAQGDLTGALELLDEGERHERRDPVPRARPIPAMKARIHIVQGRLDEASGWVVRAKLSVDDDLGYLREFEHLTLARLLIERSAREAARLLERLHTAAFEPAGESAASSRFSCCSRWHSRRWNNAHGALDLLARALTGRRGARGLSPGLSGSRNSNARSLTHCATSRGLAGEYTRRVLVAFDPAP